MTPATTGVSGTDTSSTLTFDPNGAFESLDNGEEDTDAFTYTAFDGDADSVAANVDVTITGVNDAPVANNDTGTTNEDTVLTVAAPGVLGNDTDVDVEPLTVAEVNGSAADVGSEISLASGAKVTLNADGSYSYTPSPAHQGLDTGESATDSFTYKASDGTVSSNLATVTITITGVNDAPVCDDVAITTDENTVGSTTPDCTDVDDEPLTYTVTAAATGVSGTDTTSTLTFDPNGQFESLDDGEEGTDAFTYTAFDGTADSLAADVDVTITGVNDAPVCDDVTITTDENTAGSTAPDCTDVDIEALTYTVTDALFGDSGTDGSSSLTFDPNGQFEYLDDTESASDAFMYTASDGDADSVPADVDVTITGVNDAPVANNDSGTTNEDTVLTVAAPGVLGNDTDVDVEPLTVAEVNGSAVDVGSQITLASGAKVTLNADGSYSYTPSPAHQGLDTGESALDSFTYKASDGTVSSNSATVTITITGVNDAPVANNDSGTTNEDTVLTVAAPGVLDNDTDVDIETLSVAEINGSAVNVGSEITLASGAKVTLNADGSYSYTPSPAHQGLDTGESATDSFTYKASDGTVSSNSATVTITSPASTTRRSPTTTAARRTRTPS